MTTNVCPACKHILDQYWLDDHAQSAWCNKCDEELCSACAGYWDADGGYGDDGSQVRVVARCKACVTPTFSSLLK